MLKKKKSLPIPPIETGGTQDHEDLLRRKREWSKGVALKNKQRKKLGD